MILPIKITVQEISKAGRGYKWKSCDCPSCQKRMWGHGFVLRYFSECEGGVLLKRYRCNSCGSVFTARPEDYWPRIRSSIATIYSCLRSKLNFLKWPAGLPRQRGDHWLRRFVDLAKMELQKSLPLFLESCFTKKLRFFA